METNNRRNYKSLVKVGSIISKIGVVLYTIAVIGLLIAAITVNAFNIPIKDIQIKGDSNITVQTDESIPVDTIEEFLKHIKIEDEVFDGYEYDGADITNNGNEIILKGTYSTQISPNAYKVRLWAPVVGALLTLINLIFLSRLFTTLKKSDTPFTMEVVRDMKYLGYSFIPVIFSKTLESIFVNGFSKFSLSISTSTIIIILVIFALVKIFEHGVQLQIEADETL
ncbi:MAG: DUF2975 domain-containing protein [Tissierellia bacterium]|nr:DUF2975 domain-containing protein [Tissierellia bacterium]